MEKTRKNLFQILTLIVLAIVFGVVVFLKSPTNAQQVLGILTTDPDQSKPIQTLFAQPVETPAAQLVQKLPERPRYVTLTASNRLSSNSALAAAASNRNFKFNLSWNFGRNTQRGWYLYESLIQKTISADKPAESPEFANAVAEWQYRHELLPTGVLERETFEVMVELWQTQRLGKRGSYATDAVLMSAPISDFYDPSREAALLRVERQTYQAYKKMIAAAAKDLSLRLKTTPSGELASDEKFLKIVSAFRSREYQERLRKLSPASGTAALAVNFSPHFTGQALDIYVGGEPVTTKDFNRAVQVQTPVYKWLVKNAHRFGFYPYFYEPWHWEYVPPQMQMPADRPEVP